MDNIDKAIWVFSFIGATIWFFVPPIIAGYLVTGLIFGWWR